MFVIGYFFQYVHYAVFVFFALGIIIAIADIIWSWVGFCRKKDKNFEETMKPLSDKLQKKLDKK